ncbi:MAG: hypothetical protein K2W82_19455 [Candidatus Obscuribacterales bacterium]|nr:hypothetical protein [Candidatus Obscuribacterales bacterium]
MSTTLEKADQELACKHSPCRCPVTDGDEYCSEECRTATDMMECPCSHEHCQMDNEPVQ